MKPWKDMPETCATCAIRHPQTSVCQLTGQQVSNEDFCSKHAETIDVCELCHKPALQTLCFPAEGGYHFICQDCFRLLSTCRMCESGRSCAFQDDTTMPKIVTKSFRQGPAVIQTQVRNPDLVQKTCEAGCKCYDKAGQYCRREDGYCVEHNFHSPF